MINKLSFLLFFPLLINLVGCSSAQINPEDPEALYRSAEESFEDERYLIAIEKYRDIKNRFPYSSRAVDSELRVADAFYAQESYIEAVSAYEIFRELHPTHRRIDYVQYQIGISYFQQIPDNEARDLSAAHRSIAAFQMLIQKYPSSSYVKQAEDKIVSARKRLADHQSYVAAFYFNRRHYLSASYRYSALLQEFPDLGYDEEALFRLGKSYYEIRMYGNARGALEALMSKYPEGQYAQQGATLLKKLGSKK